MAYSRKNKARRPKRKARKARKSTLRRTAPRRC
jgi:hypothetical protein